MPPKKKGDGKKGAGKVPERPPNPYNIIPKLDPETKQFYLVQINDLEERLVRYQKKCDELEVANGQFNEKFEQIATDKKDIIAHWKREVEHKTAELGELNERHVGLQQIRDNEKEDFKRQLHEQKSEHQDVKDNLNFEINLLSSKLAGLEEFKIQKEDMLARLAKMEEELELRQQEHKEHLDELEKKSIADKQRLKKDMIVRVNHVAAEFRKVSNKQMAETTKRTIRENVSINAQLAKMSDKTIELIQENDELKAKEKKMKQHIDMLETNEKELAKNNHSHTRVIHMIADRCRNQESAIEDFENKEKACQELEKRADLLNKKMSSTSTELDILRNEKEAMLDRNNQLTQTVLEESTARVAMQKTLSQAAQALKAALTSAAPDDEDIDEDRMISNLQKRDRMLENLLNILNCAVDRGIGLKSGEMGKQWSADRGLAPRPGEMGKPQMAIGGGRAMLPQIGSLSHYSPGDLGIIPRPTQHIPSSMDKMKQINKNTKLRSLRRVLFKSVACQTVSAPKVLFYADQLGMKKQSIKKVSRPSQQLAESIVEGVLKDLQVRELKCPPSGSAPLPIPKQLLS